MLDLIEIFDRVGLFFGLDGFLRSFRHRNRFVDGVDGALGKVGGIVFLRDLFSLPRPISGDVANEVVEAIDVALSERIERRDRPSFEWRQGRGEDINGFVGEGFCYASDEFLVIHK